MEVADSFVAPSSPAETWEFFWDLSRVGKCLPGCEEITRLSDTSYRLRMTQRVGPFKVAMDVNMNVDEVEEGRRIAASGEGKDRMGNRLQIKRLAAELSEAPAGGDAGRLRDRVQPVRQAGVHGQRRDQAQGRRDPRGIHRQHRAGAGRLISPHVDAPGFQHRPGLTPGRCRRGGNCGLQF